MRTHLNGSISFGLVKNPIGLALATSRSDGVLTDASHSRVRPPRSSRSGVVPLHGATWSPRARQGLGGREGRVVLSSRGRPRQWPPPALAAIFEIVPSSSSFEEVSTRFYSIEPITCASFGRCCGRATYVLLPARCRTTGRRRSSKLSIWGRRSDLCLIRSHGDTLGWRRSSFGRRTCVRRTDRGGRPIRDQVQKAELQLAESCSRGPRLRWNISQTPERVPPRPAAMLECEARGGGDQNACAGGGGKRRSRPDGERCAAVRRCPGTKSEKAKSAHPGEIRAARRQRAKLPRVRGLCEPSTLSGRACGRRSGVFERDACANY